MWKKPYSNSGLILLPALALVFGFGSSCSSNKSDDPTMFVAIGVAKPGAAERMVLDNEQVTVYVECTNLFVNGVDSDTLGFAFSPNIAVFNKNLEVVTANYDTRSLNGNDALGDAYHDLVLKYERGN